MSSRSNRRGKPRTQASTNETAETEPLDCCRARCAMRDERAGGLRFLMLRGPARRPLFVVPVLVFVLVLFLAAFGRRWLLVGVMLLTAVGSVVWDRWGPQRRAGYVRRSWPWHDD